MTIDNEPNKFPTDDEITNLFKQISVKPSDRFYKKENSSPWNKTKISWKSHSLKLAFSFCVLFVIFTFSINDYSYNLATYTPTPSRTPTVLLIDEIAYTETIQPTLVNIETEATGTTIPN